MKLPMRQEKKRNQALDAVASVAKTWSEWRLGERASTSWSKGAKSASKSAKKASKRAKKVSGNAQRSSLGDAIKGTPLKIAGAVALVGGVGAAIAKKLKGSGQAEPLYTPPPAPAPFDPPTALADIPSPPPTPVAVDDLAPSKPDDGAAADAGEPPNETADVPEPEPADPPNASADERPAEDEPDTDTAGDDDGSDGDDGESADDQKGKSKS